MGAAASRWAGQAGRGGARQVEGTPRGKREGREMRLIREPQIKSNEFSVLTLQEIFTGESLMKFEMIMQFNTETFCGRLPLQRRPGGGTRLACNTNT